MAESLPENWVSVLRTLRAGANLQRQLPSEVKNQALNKMAEELLRRSASILHANNTDLARLPKDTIAAFRDRLTLTIERISGMAESLRQVAALADPVGEVVERRTLDNGLQVRRVRAPLGVLFMIFESRPNVILEAFSLAFKAGNVILLRGGSESQATAKELYQIMRETLAAAGLSHCAFYGMDDYDRSLVELLLKRKDFIDIVVPRGGDKLIDFVQRTAAMPIIKNDRGLCHAYIDEDADLGMACKIVVNGKTQRPGVCNALETVLVHRKIAAKFFPLLVKAMSGKNLHWHADQESFELLRGTAHLRLATAEDWDTEYLDLILNCRVVGDLAEALAHIATHGSKHSDTIITSSKEKAERFMSEVDAAAVYWNASTRFTDGFMLGLGGELGISTQKLHVRGPVGLTELTTPRWLITGTGQVRE